MRNHIELFVKITLYKPRYLCYAEGTVQAKKGAYTNGAHGMEGASSPVARKNISAATRKSGLRWSRC